MGVPGVEIGLLSLQRKRGVEEPMASPRSRFVLHLRA
jgi:hypothetical protein